MANAPSPLPPRKFSPESFLGCLATALGLWIIVGAMAYSGWATASRTSKDFSIVFLLFIVMIYSFALFFALSEVLVHDYPWVSTGSLFTAGILTLTITIAYCIVTADERDVFQHAFIIMGSVPAGWILEWSAGPVTACSARLARGARINVASAAGSSSFSATQ